MQLSVFLAVFVCFFSAALSASCAKAQAIPSPPPPIAIAHPAYPSGATTPLGEQITALLADPSVSRAHWGIAVTALDGMPLYGFDEGKLSRPASNNKIFTTATAMALLGPARTFDTRIFGQLDAATGTVTGDLDLVGGGDANFAAADLPYVPPALRHQAAQNPTLQAQTAQAQTAQNPTAQNQSAQNQTAPSPPPVLADLSALADQIVAKGVKRIDGNIVGDDTLFPYQPYAEDWAQDDEVWGYGAPVSALSIANNQLKLTVTPGTSEASPPDSPGSAAFAPATVSLDQNGVPYYTVEAQVSTVPAGVQAEGIQVERLPGSRVVRVYGSLVSNAAPDKEELAIADPAEYAAMALRAMLQQRGVVITGSALARHRPVTDATGYLPELLAPDLCDPITIAGGACVNSCPAPARPGELHPTAARPHDLLASHISAPLGEDVVLTNKISQNLHAELLLHHLGRLSACGQGSIVDGARMIRAYLMQAGLDPGDFIFFDGSGLSAHDLVTPRATAQFLAFAARQPWFPAWKASLPDAGEDGTLSKRFPDPPLKDRLFAKTGTLGESRALSGYLDAASGRTLIFSIFVDDHTPASSADRAIMDKIVTAIAAAE